MSFDSLRPAAFVARGPLVSFLVRLCLSVANFLSASHAASVVDVSRRQWEMRIATTRQMSVCLRVRMHPHIDVHGQARGDTKPRAVPDTCRFNSNLRRRGQGSEWKRFGEPVVGAVCCHVGEHAGVAVAVAAC